MNNTQKYEIFHIKRMTANDIRNRLAQLEYIDSENDNDVFTIAQYNQILNAINTEIVNAAKTHPELFDDKYATITRVAETQIKDLHDRVSIPDIDELSAEEYATFVEGGGSNE